AQLSQTSPRMRPSSTRNSTPSSATVVSKTLRRPCASMQAIASAPFQQVLRCQAEPLNGCVDPGPLVRQELLAFALEQQIARAGSDEHAETSLRLDELLLDQLLIALQNRD